MLWTAPAFDEVKMDAEIGSYNEDDPREKDRWEAASVSHRPHGGRAAIVPAKRPTATDHRRIAAA
jgi:hypothetical protein